MVIRFGSWNIKALRQSLIKVHPDFSIGVWVTIYQALDYVSPETKLELDRIGSRDLPLNKFSLTGT